MTRRLWRGSLSIGGALILLAGCGTPAAVSPGSSPPGDTARHIAAIPRFARVRDPMHPERRIYRGGKASAGDLSDVADLGVTTVVSFQNAYDGDGEAANVRRERRYLDRLGLTFISLPMSPEEIPSDETVTRFLELARDSAQQPLFVHDLLGRDRLGAMIAIYRIYEDGYTADQALAEMESFGFDADRYPAMAEFVRDRAARVASEAS